MVIFPRKEREHTRNMRVVLFCILAVGIMTARSSNGMAGNVKETYFYNETFYDVLGGDKTEGTNDAIAAVTAGVFGLISGQDYNNTIHILTKDEFLQDITYTGLTGCHDFPSLDGDFVLGDDHVQRIRQPQNKTTVPDGSKRVTVCSITYAAWYNTTVVNYLLSHREFLSLLRKQDRNMQIFCLPDYPYENKILTLWDDAQQPIPDVPEYPW